MFKKELALYKKKRKQWLTVFLLLCTQFTSVYGAGMCLGRNELPYVQQGTPWSDLLYPALTSSDAYHTLTPPGWPSLAPGNIPVLTPGLPLLYNMSGYEISVRDQCYSRIPGVIQNNDMGFNVMALDGTTYTADFDLTRLDIVTHDPNAYPAPQLEGCNAAYPNRVRNAVDWHNQREFEDAVVLFNGGFFDIGADPKKYIYLGQINPYTSNCTRLLGVAKAGGEMVSPPDRPITANKVKYGGYYNKETGALFDGILFYNDVHGKRYAEIVPYHELTSEKLGPAQYAMGGAIILEGGKIRSVSSMAAPIRPLFEQARMVLGLNKQGDLLNLLAFQPGRPGVGITAPMAAQWMRDRGAYSAINLDNGGSVFFSFMSPDYPFSILSRLSDLNVPSLDDEKLYCANVTGDVDIVRAARSYRPTPSVVAAVPKCGLPPVFRAP